MPFQLDRRLAQDCHIVGDLPLSQLLLMNDQQYPWLILVPRREDAIELYELSAEDQKQLWLEIADISRVMKMVFQPFKLNIGALGNVVQQLHVHVVGRNTTDKAWPGPVWGAHPPVAYSPEQKEKTVFDLCEALNTQQLLV